MWGPPPIPLFPGLPGPGELASLLTSTLHRFLMSPPLAIGLHSFPVFQYPMASFYLLLLFSLFLGPCCFKLFKPFTVTLAKFEEQAEIKGAQLTVPQTQHFQNFSHSSSNLFPQNLPTYLMKAPIFNCLIIIFGIILYSYFPLSFHI